MMESSGSDEDIIFTDIILRSHSCWNGDDNELNKLVEELKLYRHRFTQYFRMTGVEFEPLLGSVPPHLKKLLATHFDAFFCFMFCCVSQEEPVEPSFDCSANPIQNPVQNKMDQN